VSGDFPAGWPDGRLWLRGRLAQAVLCLTSGSKTLP
jgi:hypothetical protein